MKPSLHPIQKVLLFILLLNFSLNSMAQNAITLDPNTTGTNQARTLSEGVGSTSQFIPYGKSSGTSIGFLSYLGLKSYTTIANANSQTAIYGFSDKSTTTNNGIVGGAEAMSSANAYAGRFSAFGNSTNSIYGLYASAHNEGLGNIYAGYFSPYNRTNEGRGYKYGVYISNNANYNDTTTAQGRFGLYSTISGKTKYNSYGIYSSNGSGDTVTHTQSQYAVFGSVYGKNNSTNYASYNYASNNGTGNAHAGYFYASNTGIGAVTTGYFGVGSGSTTSTGTRTAIRAENISSNYDTVTVQSRYGIYAIVNGRAKNNNYAIRGENYNYYGDTLTANFRYGVSGSANGNSKYQNIGLDGYASTNTGTSASAIGVQGSTYSNGSGSATGGNFSANAQSTSTGPQYGIRAYANNGGYSSNNSSLYGGYYSTYSVGNNLSYAINANAYGSNTSLGSIYGINSSASSNNTGNTNNTYGIYTQASGGSPGLKYGIYATSSGSGGQFAGYFQGNVHVNGNLSKSGGTFKIDHPQDPENKYLVHSFVESPEMKNIYDGTISTDANGDATITMPSYFQALNVSFRYQLTCIGQFAQAIVSEEISKNSFKIKTDKPNVKVSWQVTGVRNDEWAKANPIIVEQAKEKDARGKYLNPEVFKQDQNKSIHAINAVADVIDYEKEAKAQQAKIEIEQKQRDEQVKENLARKKQQDAEEAQRAAEQKRMEEEQSKRQQESTKQN